MLYFKKLDTLRFFSFFLVFWSHLFTKNFTLDWLTENQTIQTIIRSFIYTGGIGVQIFFVISGFLITYLLIKEFQDFGKINVKHFYFRRILRIWPLYYLIFLTGIFILPALFNSFKFDASAWKNLSFLNNFDSSYKEQNIAVGWSVAIEEQFYLFWPLCFVALFKKKLLNLFCVVCLLLSSFYILYYPVEAHFHTFGNINYLMIGCLGATFYSKYQQQVTSSFITSKRFFYGIIFITILFVTLSNLYHSTLHFLMLLTPINYLLIIIYLVENNQANEKVSLFSKWGKYTYGMYLYHPIFIIFTKMGFDRLHINYETNLGNILLIASIALPLTIGVSILSYRYFEKPFLVLKSKLSHVQTRL